MKHNPDPTVHEILREIPYGIYVVGVHSGDDGNFNALLVSWLAQCSFDPPMIMIAVRRGTRSYDLIKEGKVFSVNLIDKKEEELARHFVKPSDRIGDKLEKTSHIRERTGAPILPQAFAFLECEVRGFYEPGDHAIVIGEVVNAAHPGSGQVLTCSDLHWHYAG
jgi:flavin reductase (DIM6/NTAB) family NADH-FMN oxidoreductase RutF